MRNKLYTTVTLSDFNDTEYINELIKLNIGFELALLTPIPATPTTDLEELSALKKEIDGFNKAFEKFNIPVDEIRIHQPGGYNYYWFIGYDILKDFFSYCSTLGFQHYIIHAPYGNSSIEQETELSDYKTKIEDLGNLHGRFYLEVEEIVTSNKKLPDAQNIRIYSGDLLEELLRNTKAIMLLDTYECGGIEKTIERLQELKSHGFKVGSVHLHKNKHQLLTKNEVQELLAAGYTGNLVNEGFISENGSFDKFIKTKDLNNIIFNKEKIEQLKGYLEFFPA